MQSTSPRYNGFSAVTNDLKRCFLDRVQAKVFHTFAMLTPKICLEERYSRHSFRRLLKPIQHSNAEGTYTTYNISPNGHRQGSGKFYYGEGLCEYCVYIDNLREGLSLDYREGQLKGVHHYKRGLLNGECLIFYLNSDILHIRTHHVNGREEGIRLIYYDDGALSSKTSFINGKCHGLHEYYHIDGSLKGHVWYHHGDIVGQVTFDIMND